MGATMGTAATVTAAKLRQSEAGPEAEQERRGAEGETNTQHDMDKGEDRVSIIFVSTFVIGRSKNKEIIFGFTISFYLAHFLQVSSLSLS